MAKVTAEMDFSEILNSLKSKSDLKSATAIAKAVNKIDGCKVTRQFVQALFEGTNQTAKNINGIVEVLSNGREVIIK